MMKNIDYYLTPISPWTYLGHERFAQIAQRRGAAVAVKPVDYGVIFPQSGGLPLAKRAPQRQAYRLMELVRWRDFLGVPLNLRPKFFPEGCRSERRGGYIGAGVVIRGKAFFRGW